MGGCCPGLSGGISLAGSVWGGEGAAGLGTHQLQGSLGRAGLWGCGGRVGCGWVDPARPRSPRCVSSYTGPASLGVSPHLRAPHRRGCLETGDSIRAGCLSSGAGLREPLGDDARIRNPPTPPACPSESLTPPVSSRHRGSLWLHAPSWSCVILPFLCEGELWPVGRMVVLSLSACTW